MLIFPYEEKFQSIANDTHLFNIRYHDTENPWNAQYTIPPMDDGNGNECEVCPLWGHSITIIQDANREVMLAGYGFKDTKGNGNGNIYQFDQTYGMSQGQWTVERESPRFLGWVENYFGLTVPMKWIKQCAKENKDLRYEFYSMYDILFSTKIVGDSELNSLNI